MEPIEPTHGELTLLARLRALPEVRMQVEHLLAEVADAAGQLPTADAAEDAVVARIRHLGLAALQAWAQRRHDDLAVRPAGARKGLKKKSAG